MATRLSSLTLRMLEDVLDHGKGDSATLLFVMRHIARVGAPPAWWAFHDETLMRDWETVQKGYAHLG
jgi:hypothetical protein